jgi:2-dehydropantoate 2-reductase
MRILVLGTGAMGCMFAARLAAHAEVWMVGEWAQGVAAVSQDGIHVVDPDGRLWRAYVKATGDPADAPPADIALVLVKSYQTARAAQWASQRLAEDGLAVTLQNGLDNLPRLAAEVGPERAAVGVTYNGATLLGPGEVRHVVILPTYLALPVAATRGSAAKLDALAQLLDDAGLETQVTQDVDGRLWGKAIANAAINPLTALWRVPNEGPLARPERRELLHALALEAAAVAAARGVRLPFADPVAYVESVCRATGANRSSMLQDVEHGRPTEIDSITGVIVAEAKRLRVPVPVNEAVWKLVRAL